MKIFKVITFLLCSCLFVAGGFFTFRLFQEVQDLKALFTAQLKSDLEGGPRQVQKEIIIERIQGEGHAWSDLQAKVKDNIVQVFSQVAAIDLLEPYKTPAQGQRTGSGFFISKDGEIVTNAHVVDQAKSIWIQIPSLGKQQIDVDVVGVSPDRDIALLKVRNEGMELIKSELKEIQCLALGDSDQVHRADEIMTLGYPLSQQGLKSTVGVVSGRECHLIQVDAPINPGNSGGPSVDRLGRVVGINTAYIPDAQNVGYIIPVNELKIILDDLRKVHLLSKPFLGLLFNNARDSFTTYLGNPTPGGVYVVVVYKDSQLHKSGVQNGDMIYSIIGHRV
ncbi:MAG: S1C family serine protease, partial [Candidatus Babeliales bacterium]